LFQARLERKTTGRTIAQQFVSMDLQPRSGAEGVKTTVHQTLIRGLATAGPLSVSSLPSPSFGHEAVMRLQDRISPPPKTPKGCSGAFRPRHWLQKLYSSSSYAAIRTGSTSRAIAHTECRHLTCDSGGDHVLAFALCCEPAIAPAQPQLGTIQALAYAYMSVDAIVNRYRKNPGSLL
jgi:hypothetical protein